MDKQKRFVAYLRAMGLKNYGEFIYLIPPAKRLEVQRDFEQEYQKEQAFKKEKQRMLDEVVENIDLSH